MDSQSALDSVLRLAHAAEDPVLAWREFTELVAREVGDRFSARIREVDARVDIRDVRDQLMAIFGSEPPAASIDALYFGLFESIDDGSRKGVGYYVAGTEGFDPDDGDSLCDPVWLPDGRYLRSRCLDAVNSEEIDAAAEGHREAREFLGWVGQLGAGLIVSKLAVAGLSEGRAIVVGFDSGDFVTLGA